MKRLFLAGLFLVFSTGMLMASTEALFSSVQGKVTVKAKKGKKTRTAKNGGQVKEGEKVTANKNASAALRLFDGSELIVKSHTSFTLTQLRQSSAKEKILRFKLAFGSLLAKVKKLMTASSSFEIQAGGVVCGVRGTQFSLDYDPDQGKLDLDLTDGSVYANTNGQTYTYNAPAHVEFTNGVPNGNPNGSGPGAAQTPTNGATDISLGDLNGQFGNGSTANGDNNVTDPGTLGSRKVNVRANAPPVEALP